MLVMMVIVFYEWNIDRKNEYQIINLLYEMMMIVNVYRIKTSNSNFRVIGVLVDISSSKHSLRVSSFLIKS